MSHGTGYFGDYNDEASRRASYREEIDKNERILTQWVDVGYHEKWVKDPVARFVMQQECYRILATRSYSTDKEKPAATDSNIHLSWNMIQPLRIPRLK